MVTLIIEIPVLLMISGGSAKLCALIGRNKYQLLIAFLPLSSAISGNCGKFFSVAMASCIVLYIVLVYCYI